METSKYRNPKHQFSYELSHGVRGGTRLINRSMIDDGMRHS